MTNGVQTSAYREKLIGHRNVGCELQASYSQFATLSLRLAWNRAIASVRNLWLHLPPDQCPD